VQIWFDKKCKQGKIKLKILKRTDAEREEEV